jgi:hypothetical protein
LLKSKPCRSYKGFPGNRELGRVRGKNLKIPLFAKRKVSLEKKSHIKN